MVESKFGKEPAQDVKAQNCIGTRTRTVLATSTHANSLDPGAGRWQEQVPDPLGGPLIWANGWRRSGSWPHVASIAGFYTRLWESARMNKLELEKEARAQAIASIQRYFEENLTEPIGNLPAGQLLEFFMEEIGP